jgi:hypothetical protein
MAAEATAFIVTVVDNYNSSVDVDALSNAFA